MSNQTTEQATEKIARRMAKESMGSESLWELFLQDAYREYYELAGEQEGE